jgi:hypothetical protein
MSPVSGAEVIGTAVPLLVIFCATDENNKASPQALTALIGLRRFLPKLFRGIRWSAESRTTCLGGRSHSQVRLRGRARFPSLFLP